MIGFNLNKIIILGALLLVLFLIFKLLKFEVKVSLDVLKVKARIQIYVLGFIRIINLKIFYSDCGLYIKMGKKPNKKLEIKPMSKFESKLGVNFFKVMVEKELYLNMLAGVEQDAYITSLLCSSFMIGASVAKNFVLFKTLDVNINSTTNNNQGKIFVKYKFKTNVAKIFKAFLISL